MIKLSMILAKLEKVQEARVIYDEVPNYHFVSIFKL